MIQVSDEGARARKFERMNDSKAAEDLEEGIPQSEDSNLEPPDPKSNHQKEALHLLRIYKQKPEQLITLLGLVPPDDFPVRVKF